MTKRILLSTAAAALLLGLPAVAGAQTTSGDPIVIQHSDVHNGEYNLVSTGHNFDSNVIFVRFKNTGSNAATKVVFDVRSDGQSVGEVTATGTFSPGVSIAKSFDNDLDYMQPVTDATIVPVEVDYADGQVWTASQS